MLVLCVCVGMIISLLARIMVGGDELDELGEGDCMMNRSSLKGARLPQAGRKGMCSRDEPDRDRYSLIDEDTVWVNGE